MIYKKITDLIGNTPLLQLDPEVHGLKNFDIYAKLEYYNPFGSLKDRIAWKMLEVRLNGSEGKTVLESSSGNTAKALAALCKIYGLNFKTVTNRIKVPEVRTMLKFLGAEVEELPGLSDCPDPSNPNDPLVVAGNLVNREPDKWLYTDQYFNELNWQAHYQTGLEIAADLPQVDYYFGILGTCGSTLGPVRALREKGHPTKVVGVVSEAGSWVPGGRNINELWETGFFDKNFYADILSGDIKKAVQGMQTLNQKYGILAGPTSGLNYQCMIENLQEMDETTEVKQTVVFIACDRAEPYMNYLQKQNPDLFSKDSHFQKLTVSAVTTEQAVSAKSMTAQELFKQKENKIIIDIRGNFAYSKGHIPGSINILDELLAQTIEQGKVFPEDKELVLVCTVGKISQKFAYFLQQQGYVAVYLEQGLSAWKQQRFEVVGSLVNN